MRWTTLSNSKARVRKAGKSLSNSECEIFEYMDAYDVLSNWRSAHAYPMHSVLISLRRQAKLIDKDAIVVQRLKRAPSIINKLFREPHMDLDRMQDIAGCRAVVTTVSKAKKLERKILDSKTRNKFHSSKDYIKNPKDSGYRGIHLIYKYGGTKQEYNNLFVEIQLRSKIQHSWATAVEVVDTFTNQALKSNQGQMEWKEFFRYASAEFSKLEKTPIIPSLTFEDTNKKLSELLTQLQVINKLQAFSVTSKHIENSSATDNEYYLLILNTEESSIGFKTYHPSQLSEANNNYSELEKKFKDDITKNVVLVSSFSIRELKKAYPNYFADTRDFISNIEKCINAKNPQPII